MCISTSGTLCRIFQKLNIILLQKFASQTGNNNNTSNKNNNGIKEDHAMSLILLFTVGNVRQVIELLSFVHKQVRSGKSINAALKAAKKDRKTIDRFRNIYYLHILNNDRLKQVSYL